jgi:hypothetical protein
MVTCTAPTMGSSFSSGFRLTRQRPLHTTSVILTCIHRHLHLAISIPCTISKTPAADEDALKDLHPP